jgi:hypothetical protein
LHKHGGLPEEDRTTPIDLLRDKDSRKQIRNKKILLAVHLFKDNVCKDCGLKEV